MGISDPNLSSYLPVLVVDTDQLAADRLLEYLKEHGFHGAVATSCWSAHAALQNSAYGTLVVVADLNQRSDLECLTALRMEGRRTWIIVISLRRYPDARRVLLDCGADSLLIAPFSLEELLGRLTAFARRSRPA